MVDEPIPLDVGAARPGGPPPLRAEEQHAAFDFIAVAAHELRTPLAGVLGAAETLLARWNELDDRGRYELVEVGARQGQRVARLIDELLQVSSLDAGAVEPRRVRVELARAVAAATADAGVAATLSCPPDVAVFADADHVHRLIVNYLTNAAKYGRPPVQIRVRTRLGAGDVELVVADHGPGVPADFVGRLFERFSRAPSATHHDQDHGAGAGLGLAIVAGLARVNGGEAFYRKGRPGGSVFGVVLPAAP